MDRDHDTTTRRVRALGAKHGRDLGEALLLVIERAGRTDREFLRRLARTVAGEVSARLLRLRESGMPGAIVDAYVQACRVGIREAVRSAAGADISQAAARQVA